MAPNNCDLEERCIETLPVGPSIEGRLEGWEGYDKLYFIM